MKGTTMKISSAERLRCQVVHMKDVYIVRSPRKIITIIDNQENIQDLFFKTSLRYTIDEAEELVHFLKSAWTDYYEDPYYWQGQPLYPIYQSPKQLRITKIERRQFTPTIIVYRYKLAGEWVYGITNRWADIEAGDHKRAVEAPMDGWDKWLMDRKAMLKNKWIAEHGGDL